MGSFWYSSSRSDIEKPFNPNHTDLGFSLCCGSHTLITQKLYPMQALSHWFSLVAFLQHYFALKISA